MNITKKELEKLDRIEKLEYKIGLMDIEKGGTWTDFLLSGFKFSLIFSLFGLLSLYSTYERNLELSLSFFNLAISILIAGVVCSVIIYFIDNIKIKKLNEKYFEINKNKTKG